MLSSGREFRTFLFNHRNSAPSSYRACIGIAGTTCCAMRGAPKQNMIVSVIMLDRRALGVGLDLISMIGTLYPKAITPTIRSPGAAIL
jgi:hypothetical protein